MAVIQLPLDADPTIPSQLWDRFGIRVSGRVEMPGTDPGTAWTRISAQIYNERADYEKLAAAVLQLKSEQEANVEQVAKVEQEQ